MSNPILARAALRDAYERCNTPDKEPVIRLALLVDDCIYSDEVRVMLYRWLADQLS